MVTKLPIRLAVRWISSLIMSINVTNHKTQQSNRNQVIVAYKTISEFEDAMFIVYLIIHLNLSKHNKSLNLFHPK